MDKRKIRRSHSNSRLVENSHLGKPNRKREKSVRRSKPRGVVLSIVARAQPKRHCAVAVPKLIRAYRRLDARIGRPLPIAAQSFHPANSFWAFSSSLLRLGAAM